MGLLVISDLHIWGPQDPLYTSLLRLLRHRAGSGDTVVLAGDLFDLFVGNKSIFITEYHEFYEALQDAAKRGIKCHYVEGNHDFNLKKAFRDVNALSLHPHDVCIEISGKKFYIAHGDTVVKTDYGYRFLRAFFRSPVMKFLVWILPGQWLAQIGKWSSQLSRSRKQAYSSEISINRIEALRRIYRSFAAEKLGEGFDFVVMGHCHDLDEMTFSIGSRKGQYVNVGFPRTHGSFLSWSAGEEKIQREKLP